MAKIYYKGRDYSRAIGGSGGGGGSVDSTDIPTAGKVSEFDSNAHINSEDMSAEDISDFVDGIDGQGANLADYVIEQGTETVSGSEWTYRKWNSGIAECWGSWSGSLANYGTAFGGYAYFTSVYLPTGLFTAAPLTTYSAQVDSSFALTGTQIARTNEYVNCYAVSGASGTQTVIFMLHCIGRWK